MEPHPYLIAPCESLIPLPTSLVHPRIVVLSDLQPPKPPASAGDTAASSSVQFPELAVLGLLLTNIRSSEAAVPSHPNETVSGFPLGLPMESPSADRCGIPTENNQVPPNPDHHLGSGIRVTAVWPGQHLVRVQTRGSQRNGRRVRGKPRPERRGGGH